MNKKLLNKFIPALLITVSILLSCRSDNWQERRIVIMIGDGMGFEQIKAAEYYRGGPFPVKGRALFSGSVTTLNYSGGVTDSAAGATAMATGQKVSNGVLSRMIPGDSSDLETVFEYAKKRGYRSGLITTSYIIDATPAAFVSHSSSRADYAQISSGLISHRPDIVIGGLSYLTDTDFYSADYSIFNSIEEYYSSWIDRFVFVKLGDGTAPYEYETYTATGTLPHLFSRSIIIAGDSLRGSGLFILMAEGGRIDHSGHSGSIQNSVFETTEFFEGADHMQSWLASKGNYLMIITADHETGGLNVLNDNGAGNFPDVEWTSTVVDGRYSHTSRPVPVLVFSDLLSSEEVNYISDNTDIHRIVKEFINHQ